MLKYRLPHFEMDLPDNVVDHSVVALTISPQGATPFSVTLTHHGLRDGTLHDHVTTEIARRESRDGYAVTWKKSFSHMGMAGFIVAGFMEGVEESAEERRLYLLNGTEILVVAAMTQGRFSAPQLDALNGLVQGLRAVEKD